MPWLIAYWISRTVEPSRVNCAATAGCTATGPAKAMARPARASRLLSRERMSIDKFTLRQSRRFVASSVSAATKSPEHTQMLTQHPSQARFSNWDNIGLSSSAKARAAALRALSLAAEIAEQRSGDCGPMPCNGRAWVYTCRMVYIRQAGCSTSTPAHRPVPRRRTGLFFGS
jgi:hypothetical protein